ncbi:hypothetical protein [Methylogaea oryzae]|uniref:Uncharacterized protein n=1 Tax=Methylogaea oryzae TaxID=1295382 RepID=A0A8D5AJC0_9GAMM|nr:hypothetical protein [Methylogaea oryzae]BBL69901.1 hypothetical protein MoryE10_05070 [Methylogaea oryzae]
MTPAAHPARRRRSFPWHQRLALLAGLTALFYFASDIVLHLLEEGTHVLLESLEMLIEEFYEHVLHMHRRQAEIFTVWTGTTLIIIVLYFTARSLIRRIVRAYIQARDWCLATVAALVAWRRTWSEADIAILAVAGGVVVFTLLALFL